MNKREIELLIGMRQAYNNGDNAMEWARKFLGNEKNDEMATTIAYDQQAGNYIKGARNNPEYRESWCRQISDEIVKYQESGEDILEIGCGEATTLSGVAQNVLTHQHANFYGFDISWSRIFLGNKWLTEHDVKATLFVANLFNIPLRTSSIPIVFTAHSLEPNGGREREALEELLRVTGRYLILIEPLYELASEKAKKRMNHHGYVTDLKKTVESIGHKIIDYRLLDVCVNELNPSGLIVVEKSNSENNHTNEYGQWVCPNTGAVLEEKTDCYYAEDSGLAYPIIKGVPILKSDYGIIASKLNL